MCECNKWKKNIFQVLPCQFAAVSTYLVISVPLQSGAQGNRVSDLGVWSWLCVLFLAAGKRRVVSDHTPLTPLFLMLICLDIHVFTHCRQTKGCE